MLIVYMYIYCAFRIKIVLPTFMESLAQLYVFHKTPALVDITSVAHMMEQKYALLGGWVLIVTIEEFPIIWITHVP